MNRHLIIPVLAVTVAGLAGVAAWGVSQASAQEGSPHSIIVQRVAERFGVSESDVQIVFDEIRKEHQSEMQKKFDEQLSEAVSNGKLTEEQKQLILAKHKEMAAARESERETVRSMSPEDRKQHFESNFNELKEWADSNNIDISFLRFKLGKGGHGGRGFHREFSELEL
ncbi:hypothetical protein KBC79_00250 [Candidatus Woesebacteria bacterium]|nr:hypothetical protein [Candidatus Woesebacteria bacterium]